ncbi:mitochondrial carrier domain-containing protein [Cyathus striatus]|nr:mitochondrial carrier domain-containing protein [Cyathus striatus]
MTSTLPPLVQAFSGAIGSASANAITYPLDLLTTRLQLDPPNSPEEKRGIRGAIRILKKIVRKHGISSLYDGILTDTSAVLLSNFFYFYFYSALRSLSTKRKIPLFWRINRASKGIHEPGLFEELLLGFIAGVASRAISTPLNIVTLRLQTAETTEDGDEPANSTPSAKNIIKSIYKEQGLGGFWRGFKLTTILSLNPSITMAFFQMFRRLVGCIRYSLQTGTPITKTTSISNANMAKTNPKPREAFFGAAISNSIAIAILYPIILAKTRLQSSSATSMRQLLLDAYFGNDNHSRSKALSSARKGTNAGFEGLYQGLEMKIIKGFLSQGVTFLIKGRIEQIIVAMYVRRYLRTAAAHVR